MSAAREARVAEICASLEDAGNAYTRRHLPFGRVEILAEAGPILHISALVYPDGSVLRTWADGSKTREPAPEVQR